MISLNLKSISRSPLRCGLFLIGLAFALLALPGTVRGQMFVSVNSSSFLNGGSNVYQYDPTGSTGTPTIFLSNLDHPRGLAFDSAGNLYVATFTNVFDADDNIVGSKGAVLKVSGGVASTFASFTDGFAEGVVTDSAGNLFVSSQKFDDTESTIYKITPDGVVSTFGSVPGQCFGLAFDSLGNLFTAGASDSTNLFGTIYEFTPGGAPYEPTPTGTPGVFVGPEAFISGQGLLDLTFDPSGNLFASTFNRNDLTGEIRKFGPDGTEITPRFATGLTKEPRGLAFDSDGNLFLAEPGIGGTDPPRVGDILKFTPGGSFTYFDDGSTGDFGTRGNRGPEFLAFAPAPVTPISAAVVLTFPNATAPLTTTVVESVDQGSLPPPPPNFALPAVNLAFEITATTTPAPPFIIAFQIPGVDQTTFKQLRVLHYVGGIPVDVTATDPAPNFDTQTIYASVSSLSPFALAAVPGLPSLGGASPYTVFALNGPTSGGKQTASFSSGTDNGKVAIAAGATLQLQAPFTINGNLYVDFGGSVSGPGKVNGARFTNQDLSGARQDALDASSQAASLAPNVTYSNITANKTVNGVSGLNVVNITGKINLNNASLTLNGPANAFFVVNVAGSISLNGSGGILATGGMPASHLLINMTGTGINLNTQVGNVIQGTVLGANAGGTIRGNVGAVLLGRNFSLSNVTLTHP